MNIERYIVARMHPAGKPLIKQYGEGNNYRVYSESIDKLSQLTEVVVTQQDEDIDTLKKRAEARDLLNTEAFGDIDLAHKKSPVWLIKGNTIRLHLSDDTLRPSDPLIATKIFLANRNWHTCLAAEKPNTDIYYLIAERTSGNNHSADDYDYVLGVAEAPSDLVKMSKNINMTRRMFDRYLDMRRIEHLSFV